MTHSLRTALALAALALTASGHAHCTELTEASVRARFDEPCAQMALAQLGLSSVPAEDDFGPVGAWTDSDRFYDAQEACLETLTLLSGLQPTTEE